MFCLQEVVWGVAYQIQESQVENVISHLNFREKDGYEQKMVTFHPQNEESFNLILYVGNHDNPFYLGPAPLKDIAHQIYHAVGPSGKNEEYLLMLATAVRRLTPEVVDHHLFALEKEVLLLSSQSKTLWQNHYV